MNTLIVGRGLLILWSKALDCISTPQAVPVAAGLFVALVQGAVARTGWTGRRNGVTRQVLRFHGVPARLASRLQLVGWIAGTLVVPPVWSIQRFQLGLTRIDPETGGTIEMLDVRGQRPTSVRGSDKRHAIDLGSHPVGCYCLPVRELSWAEIPDLASAGRTGSDDVVKVPTGRS